MADPADGGNNKTATIDPAKRTEIETGALTSDRQRRTKIKATVDELCKTYEKTPEAVKMFRKLGDEADLNGTSVEDFNASVVKALPGARKSEETDANIGMTRKDLKDFSIVRAIQSCIEHDGKIGNDCPEFEYHQQAEKAYGKRAGSFWIPADAIVGTREQQMERAEREKMRRDLQVSVFGSGGAFVPTIITTPIIEILRNKMVLRSAGIQVMGGLTGNPAIPRQTGAATAQNLGEIAALTVSTQTLDQILLSPRRHAASSSFLRWVTLTTTQ